MLYWYRCFIATRLPRDNYYSSSYLALLQNVFEVSGNCSNPIGSIDWYSTGMLHLASRIVLFDFLCLILLFPPQCLYSSQSTPVVLSYLSTVDVYILHGTWCLHNTHSVNQHQFNHQSQHTYLQVLHGCLILTKDSTGSYWPTGAKVFPNFCLKLESSLQWQMLKDAH